jgi:hypothetical protein
MQELCHKATADVSTAKVHGVLPHCCRRWEFVLW